MMGRVGLVKPDLTYTLYHANRLSDKFFSLEMQIFFELDSGPVVPRASIPAKASECVPVIGP